MEGDNRADSPMTAVGTKSDKSPRFTVALTWINRCVTSIPSSAQHNSVSLNLHKRLGVLNKLIIRKIIRTFCYEIHLCTFSALKMGLFML